MSDLDRIRRQAEERRIPPDIPRGDYDGAIDHLASCLDQAEADIDELIAMVEESEASALAGYENLIVERDEARRIADQLADVLNVAHEAQAHSYDHFDCELCKVEQAQDAYEKRSWK